MESIKNNGKFKRHFPKLGKCVCCCCCSLETSVKVCTYIVIVLVLLALSSDASSLSSFDEVKFNFIEKLLTYISLVLYVVVCVSLILLRIGISKIKIPFLDQFKYIFLPYVIFSLLSIIYSFSLVYNDEYMKKEVNKLKNEYKELGLETEMDTSYEALSKSVKNDTLGALGIAIVIYGLLAYYYFVTCSFIEDLEEGALGEKDFRKLEENQY
eukprot:jgi/Orpsp1_1/1179250/evm.model.c7180000068609.1